MKQLKCDVKRGTQLVMSKLMVAANENILVTKPSGSSGRRGGTSVFFSALVVQKIRESRCVFVPLW